MKLSETELIKQPRELMRVQAAVLFTHDTRGRMARVNEPNGGRAPRLFIGRTPHGSVWRFRDDLDDGLIRELDSVCTCEAPGDEYLVAPHGATTYEELLARRAPIERVEAGPAYRFPAELPVSTDTVVVTSENADLLRPHLAPWLADVEWGRLLVAVVHDNEAVSVCCSVRENDVANEAGVETAPAFRRRGYAARAVAGWAAAVRQRGRIPLYSTSWENSASQALATKLGLVRYGTDLHIT